MPTQVCNNNRIIAQTLFLGASVASFNNSAGWGSQASNLTVNLIEDDIACAASQFPSYSNIETFNSPNHYYDCDNCYVTPNGDIFNNNIHDPSLRMVPGKVFYKLDNTFTNPIVSQYWYKSDPGFFGRKTRIKPDGTEDTSGNTYQYDIIDTPVYFKMGNFSFCGLVQSWTRNLSNSGKSYTVNINSFQSLLNSTYVIIDKYAGSIFSRLKNSDIGSPKNYLGKNSVDYFGSISQGNLPNVFNVYGFLESMGVGNFGIARPTTEGVSVNKILRALNILTSTVPGAKLLNNTQSDNSAFSQFADKNAFSPYGRIVAKNVQLENTYQSIANTFNGHGIIAPQPVVYNTADNKCQFLLDLSEIPLLPDEFRISSPYVSIGELLNSISEQSGYDFTINCVPVVYDENIYHIIKIKSISRLSQPRSNAIENNIKLFECNGYAISSDTIGKEKNETNARSLMVGGQQQRLYQAKSYRMAYSQNTMIFNPITKEFVNYMQLGSVGPDPKATKNVSSQQYHHGKIKFPNFLTTRNTQISSGQYSTLYNNILDDEDAIQTPFNTTDSSWDDTSQTTSKESPFPHNSSRITGNYNKSTIIKQESVDQSSWGTNVNQRWFPLYMDVICPFFGYVNEEELTLSIQDDNSVGSNFKKIRPVWLDVWTGQIVVVIKIQELPELSVPLTGLDTYLVNTGSGTGTQKKSIQKTDPGPIQYCVITESEIRAALSGFDNFLVYSLAKLYKPDLIEILRRSHKNKILNKFIQKGISEVQAEKMAERETNWYWNLFASNIASKESPEGIKPGSLGSDGGDGSGSIDEAALKDLQIVHKFVAEIGKYYGKKYMVSANNLQAYNDESFAGLEIPTSIGYAYVFSGNGKLKYNYTPTNDGAWEEYGNFIDDSIVVGSPEWYNITDDMGKIKPIIGYNANYHFDNVRYSMCQLDTERVRLYQQQAVPNPTFDWDIYYDMQTQLDTQCNTEDFIFPTLDTSNLQSGDFILTNVLGSLGVSDLTSNISSFKIPAYDAFGRLLSGATNSPVYKQKLYVNTSVEENFIFLDPVNLLDPKFLIDAPGIFFNSASTSYAQDPSRTVLANTSVEDLAIYLKITPSDKWDRDWIMYMLKFSTPKYAYFQDLLDIGGNNLEFDSENNQSALMVEIHPKAAHPFFAGIPIRSNQFTYGPWTNYPYVEEVANPGYIFPGGTNIVQDNNLPPTCAESNIIVSKEMARSAVDNWVSAVSIDFRDDFVPWNYGGTSVLDTVAYKEIETKVNYQSIIETAQIEMPGLPLFNLGGNFAYNNIGLDIYSPTISVSNFIDTKISTDPISPTLSNVNIGSIISSPQQKVTNNLIFNILYLQSSPNISYGPIISNIQSSFGQNGITTTYSFRTYTRKLGLYNKEESDRIKKNFSQNFQRNKQLSELSQEFRNVTLQQKKFIDDQRLERAQFGSSDFQSKLMGWSPSTVLIGQSIPYLEEPERSPDREINNSIYSDPGLLGSKNQSATKWSLPTGVDRGYSDKTILKLDNYNSINTASNLGRMKTSVGLYERKEVDTQLKKQYANQSAMSLDGLLSPVSFYPTKHNATFNFSLYDKESCPFCKGTKKRTISLTKYINDGTNNRVSINFTCDKCTNSNNKLNAKLQGFNSSSKKGSEILPPYIISSGTDFSTLLNFNPLNTSLTSTVSSSQTNSTTASNIPINLVTLNPIVVPYGEFKNSNIQNYIGSYDGIHDTLKLPDLATPRTFCDRTRHCIEIIGRGSIFPSTYKYKLETSKNLTAYLQNVDNSQNNLDYYNKDLMLKYYVDKIENTNSPSIENNQRFFGLRGPIIIHGWGYDKEGYPVPNAADEPYDLDQFGRAKRFKATTTVEQTPVQIKSLKIGESYTLNPSLISGRGENRIYAKTFNGEDAPTADDLEYFGIKNFNGDTKVYKVLIQDDLKDPGGFEPEQGYTGSIISKTQKYDSNSRQWSPKKKMKEFYLNWAERPDLWPVGPVDLRWDSDRNVWSIDAGGASLYKFVYVTLEEDLIREKDFDETYPARGFLDDLEYTSEILPNGYRRLVYVKDKAGYTAPRGVKLLCRYNSDSGFYEPISKPVIIAVGKIVDASTAAIQMNYVQGRKSGSIPTMNVIFDNSQFNFSITSDKNGMFTFLDGKWVLTSIQSNN